MNNSSHLQNEIFIIRVRWLMILGVPLILWFHRRSLPVDLALVTVVSIMYNAYIEFYFIKRFDLRKFTIVFSLIDSVYLTFLYLNSIQSQPPLPQVYYFLILVMGIRHGLFRYHWMVLISGFFYAWATVAGNFFYQGDIDPIGILTQLLFFSAFGVMTSYIFQRNYRQQLEKEDLITELQAAYQQLCVYNAQVEELANTDPLTGVYNYRFFTDRLQKELKLSKRYNNFISLIMLDLDHFKDFNDTYGHPAGDLALKELAKIFKQNVRDKDILCRYGGEEFLILLPSTAIEEAFKCAERIRDAVEHHAIKIDKTQKVFITISGGVACYPVDASNGEQLLRIADEVLYSAKHKGRNKIHRRL